VQNNEQLQFSDSLRMSIKYILYLYCKYWADSWEVDSDKDNWQLWFSI